MRRRTLLKAGALAGGASVGAGLLGSGQADAQLVLPDGIPLDLLVRPSPPTEPFLAPLQIMPVAQPVDPAKWDPQPDPSRHQRYEEFPPVKFYEIHERAFLHQYHPQLKPTPSFGYNASIPGYTFHARYGEPVLVRRFNDLPLDHVGFGLPSTTMHLHNFHTATESDGFPMDYIDPGEHWDHHYAMFPSGFDPLQKLTTLWYHDHRMDFTAANVYAGFSGFFMIFNDQDTGDENDPSPSAWRLPSGPYDVPLMLHDVLFNEAGEAVFDIFNTDGILGDKFTVNRIVQPYFQVEPRKYRFRIVNGGPSRFYRFFLSSGKKFTVITNDGNLLPEPLEQESIAMSVGQRFDVIIDFSDHKPGDKIILQNRLQQFFGRGPTGKLVDPGDAVMRFDVIPSKGPDNSRIPEKLLALPAIDLSEVVNERLFTFGYQGGHWTINGQVADMMVPSFEVKKGTAEVWHIRNNGGDWSHPVHIHFEEFQIIEFNGKPIKPGDIRFSRKDVLTLGPSDDVKLFFRFNDFHGRYVMHCHNVVHEDHDMMLRFDVVE